MQADVEHIARRNRARQCLGEAALGDVVTVQRVEYRAVPSDPGPAMAFVLWNLWRLLNPRERKFLLRN